MERIFKQPKRTRRAPVEPLPPLEAGALDPALDGVDRLVDEIDALLGDAA